MCIWKTKISYHVYFILMHCCNTWTTKFTKHKFIILLKNALLVLLIINYFNDITDIIYIKRYSIIKLTPSIILKQRVHLIKSQINGILLIWKHWKGFNHKLSWNNFLKEGVKIILIMLILSVEILNVTWKIKSLPHVRNLFLFKDVEDPKIINNEW